MDLWISWLVRGYSSSRICDFRYIIVTQRVFLLPRSVLTLEDVLCIRNGSRVKTEWTAGASVFNSTASLLKGGFKTANQLLASKLTDMRGLKASSSKPNLNSIVWGTRGFAIKFIRAVSCLKRESDKSRLSQYTLLKNWPPTHRPVSVGVFISVFFSSFSVIFVLMFLPSCLNASPWRFCFLHRGVAHINCIVFPGGERNCGVHELICVRKGRADQSSGRSTWDPPRPPIPPHPHTLHPPHQHLLLWNRLCFHSSILSSGVMSLSVHCFSTIVAWTSSS